MRFLNYIGRYWLSFLMLLAILLVLLGIIQPRTGFNLGDLVMFFSLFIVGDVIADSHDDILDKQRIK